MAWKKNLRHVPESILHKIDGFNNPNIVVGRAKQFKAEELQNGILSHLQIYLDNSGLKFPKSIVPPPNMGRHSSWNVNGREIIRTDLPKETHYNYVSTPNYGDSSKGYHDVALPYEKYPRIFIPPRNSFIAIECPDSSAGRSHYIIKFQISEVLNRNQRDFQERLFDSLNLFQENIGDSGVEEAGATIKEYLQTLHVSWELLPPGTVEEAIERIFAGKTPTPQEKDTVQERYNFFISLSPEKMVYGTSKFLRYFGALLREDLVVFENVAYGNAIYIMFGNWEDLSKKSRIELLSGKFGDDFERVIHTGSWRRKVKKIIKEKMK